jgi:hypothetical protein
MKIYQKIFCRHPLVTTRILTLLAGICLFLGVSRERVVQPGESAGLRHPGR